jgi:hypothetical protein
MLRLLVKIHLSNMRWRRNFHYLAVKAKCFRNNLNLFFFFEWVKIPGKEIMFLELKEIKRPAVSSVQSFDQLLPVIFVLRWEYLNLNLPTQA